MYDMLILLIILYVGELSIASESVQDTLVTYQGDKHIKNNQGALSFYASLNTNPVSVNRTYLEKDENPLRVPNKFYEEKKKSKIKKLPKRTIQKIIKNGKNKSRKIYVHPVTRITTVPSVKEEIYTKRYEEIPTERNHIKRYRKNTKVVRYPMPFQKLQTRREMSFRKKNKRDVSANDIYILKDLDEIEFLNKEKDYNVIKTHVQNHW